MRLLFTALSLFCLWAIPRTPLTAQSPPTGSIVCNTNGQSPHKELNWFTVLEDVPYGYDVVGCYAPVYRWDQSPSVYYSPGPGMFGAPPDTKPENSDGNETDFVPFSNPDTVSGGTLKGCYVWFEFGNWVRSPYNDKYYWMCGGDLCPWGWCENPSASCFAAGTHVLTDDGSKPIEQLRVGDQVLSSPKENVDSVPGLRKITQVVASRAALFDIVVSGRTIRTTREHSIYTKDKGWITAASIVAGDLVRSHADAQWVRVVSVADGPEAKVYNVSVDGKSGFFVGRSEWGFSMWVSDTCGKIDSPILQLARTKQNSRNVPPLLSEKVGGNLVENSPSQITR